MYHVVRKEDEGVIRVWHATRDNARNRGTPTFRRVIWVPAFEFPACDCNVHTSSGVPCVHMLLILQHESQPLYHFCMFHVHWTRRISVRLAPSLEVPGSHVPSSSLVDNCAEDSTQEQRSTYPNPMMTFVTQGGVSSGGSYDLQDNTPNSDMGSPPPNPGLLTR